MSHAFCCGADPRSAADALVGLVAAPMSLIPWRESGSGRTRADRGVRPTRRLGTAVVLIGIVLLGKWARPMAPPPAQVMDQRHATVLIRCGVTDKAGKTWKGSLEAVSSDAGVLSIRGYHFQPKDRIALKSGSWEFETRDWAPPWPHVDLYAARPGPRPVFPNGVYATVDGGPAARFRLTLNGTLHTFALSDLEARKMLSLEDGNVEIEMAPTPLPLSDTEGEADYPAIASGPSGRLAVAGQEYFHDADRLVSREFDGSQWLPPEVIDLAETRDVFRPSVAYDGSGALHLIWSAQVNGNWDLYERLKTPSGWQPVRRLTEAPGTDFFQALAADSKGRLWLAWQGVRDGQSHIFAKSYADGNWGPEMRVSESAANAWEPALAAAPDGTVWIGWDGYDRGNYDVFVRPFRGGSPGPVQTITRSPRFQAHVSLAADAASNLWVAFDEAEVNWGKDYGLLVHDAGTSLYQSRRLRVVRLSGDHLEEPETPLSEAFPLALPDYLQYAHLGITRDGRPVVVAMQLTDANRLVNIWGTQGVWEMVGFTLDGTGWKRCQVLPQSSGQHEMRAAVATDAGGRVWSAWAADGRTFGFAKTGRQAVHVARLLDEPAGASLRLKPFQEAEELTLPTHPAEAADIRAVRQYRIRTRGKEYRIFRGDLHRHTTLSADGVGDGSLWDFYRYVLDAADMDFSTVTDHQGGGSARDWWITQKSTDLFFMPRRLTTIYAYERSVPYPNGHRNIVFPKRGAPILPIERDEQQGKKRSADAVLPYLRQYNAIAFRHTTATTQGTDWADHNNELEPMVEVYQGDRLAYEHEGGPKAPTADKLYTQRSGYKPAGFIWNALAKGFRFGFEAASDHLSTHISYSCIIADGDSREALIDAMRKRHTFGATDNIIMDFRVEADGKEYLQGDELTARRYVLAVHVIGTGHIRRVDIIHNERYAYAVTPKDKTTLEFRYTDPSPLPGENRYYVRMQQEDGNMAWSSPVWIQTGSVKGQ